MVKETATGVDPGSGKTRSRRWAWVGGSLIVGLGLAVGVSSLLWPYARINATTYSIDVLSGRCRVERYVLGLRVSDRVEETALSRLVARGGSRPADGQWRVAATLGPWSKVSPHYSFHGALGAAGELAEALERPCFSAAARQAAANTFLGLLQQDNSDGRAKRYAQEVRSLALDGSPGEGSVGVDQLPNPATGGHGGAATEQSRR